VDAIALRDVVAVAILVVLRGTLVKEIKNIQTCAASGCLQS
jgi:hypothetical protein